MPVDGHPAVNAPPVPDARPALLALDPAALAEVLGGPGRSRQVFRLLAEGGEPWADGALPRSLQARLRETTRPPALAVWRRSVAADGTAKLALRLEDGATIETVVIPELGGSGRATLCVSSQVGCARGCRFCVTATMGLSRNLRLEELLGQVHLGLAYARQRGWTLRNLVFMGMGEPLDNLQNVRGALDALTDHRGYGFAPKHVTLSTVAPRVTAVERLQGWPARLAWSLHAATPQVRARLVPAPHPPVQAIACAFARVCASDRRPLFVEMTLMDGLNDRPSDMAAAVDLFADFPTEVRFNLIAMNPGRSELTASHRTLECQAQLRAAGYFCSVRRPRGVDADAACGQLAVIA